MLKTDSNNRLARFPSWLSQRVRFEKGVEEVKEKIASLRINTVCQSARCPNIYDCFSRYRCTFLILGKYCTRSCRFCAIETRKELSCPDKNELLSIREAVRELKLQHVVITSVTRDDLIDGGAGHFADCIKVLRDEGAHLDIEVLVPDFQGNKQSIKEVVSAKPDILAHNVETVPRLYRNVRPEALYKRSLEVLRFAKDLDPSLVTKSGMMLGLGETRKEIYSAMKDLRAIGCDIITIGQYLKGDMGCLDVEEFLAPEEFDKMSVFAKEIGFKESFCGPFIRSSYK